MAEDTAALVETALAAIAAMEFVVEPDVRTPAAAAVRDAVRTLAQRLADAERERDWHYARWEQTAARAERAEVESERHKANALYNEAKRREAVDRAERAEAALRDIVEMVGNGCADIVVANTVLGRIRQRAATPTEEPER